MSDEEGGLSPSGETPAQLRARAQSIRWATQSMTDEDRVRELLEFAKDLEARAAQVEQEQGKPDTTEGDDGGV